MDLNKKRLSLISDGIEFAKKFFEVRFGTPMIINDHHRVIQDTLDLVYTGKIKRLIINVPPGYTKTELAVINFIARGLAFNPRARFLHLSYSDTLVLENSSAVKQILLSGEFQTLWPIGLKSDAKEKKKWWTTENGGMYAVSSKGQVTGFRAGHMDHSKENFTGALIIDDPVKPDDANTVEMDNVNERFNNTIASRLCIESIPVIVIQQRIAENDLTGYLLKGGSGEKWYHLNLPVKSSRDFQTKDYSHQIKIEHNLPYGWLWAHKHNDTNYLALQAHRRTYWTQYMQAPEKVSTEGALWTDGMITRWRIPFLPDDVEIVRTVVGVDPSGQEQNQVRAKNDEVGIIACAKDSKGHYYVLEDASLAGGPLDWSTEVISCYEDFDATLIVGEKNYGGGMVEHTVRSASTTDAIRYKGVTSSKGKLLRAEPIAALYEQGLVHHVGTFIQLENEMFTFNGKGKSPNRLDGLVFCLTELSGCNAKITKKSKRGLY